MAGMSSLTFVGQIQASISAQNNLTPSIAGPVANSSSPIKKYSIGTAAANAAVAGGDEAALFITSVTASSSANIDLTALTDLLNVAAVSLARVKFVWMQLLSAADDATNGNAASSVTLDSSVVNGWVSQAKTGWFANATSLFDMPNGSSLAFGTPSAGGVLVDGTHRLIKITNNDAGLAAKLQTILCGGST